MDNSEKECDNLSTRYIYMPKWIIYKLPKKHLSKTLKNLTKTSLIQLQKKKANRTALFQFINTTGIAVNTAKAFLVGNFNWHRLYAVWKSSWNQIIYNIIRWFTVSLGQMTRQPRTWWCSKYYFSFTISCKVLCKNLFNSFFYFFWNLLK